MGVNATTNAVSLANIKRGQIIIWLPVSDKNINARSFKLVPISHCLPVAATKDDAKTRPVHSIDQTHPFRISVRNKNANGEWIGHHPSISNFGRLRTIFIVSRLTVITLWNSSSG